jgi:hypothetical protein
MTARETNRKGNPPGIEASRESQTKLECRPDKFERGGRGGDPYRYFFAPDWDSNHVQQAEANAVWKALAADPVPNKPWSGSG